MKNDPIRRRIVWLTAKRPCQKCSRTKYHQSQAPIAWACQRWIQGLISAECECRSAAQTHIVFGRPIRRAGSQSTDKRHVLVVIVVDLPECVRMKMIRCSIVRTNVHVLRLHGSWIYRARTIQFFSTLRGDEHNRDTKKKIKDTLPMVLVKRKCWIGWKVISIKWTSIHHAHWHQTQRRSREDRVSSSRLARMFFSFCCATNKSRNVRWNLTIFRRMRM